MFTVFTPAWSMIVIMYKWIKSALRNMFHASLIAHARHVYMDI